MRSEPLQGLASYGNRAGASSCASILREQSDDISEVTRRETLGGEIGSSIILGILAGISERSLFQEATGAGAFAYLGGDERKAREQWEQPTFIITRGKNARCVARNRHSLSDQTSLRLPNLPDDKLGSLLRDQVADAL